MKIRTTFLLAVLATFFLACSNNDSTTSVPQSADPAAPGVSNTPLATGAVQHYICPNNCAGSGGETAGTCPVCGSAYEHNSLYHSQNTPATPPTPTTPSTPVVTGGVQHYTCPNNCAGSGGPSAGTCPVCGTAYAHNAAFHNQPSTTTSTTTTPLATPTGDQGAISPLFQNAPQQPQVNVPRISSPSNASGVYHYICSNGCAGGSGMAGNCPTCGSALAHNQAYHQ